MAIGSQEGPRAAGTRRPRSEDPRSIITPDAFHVDPSLLGHPLASPSRRLVAMIIDLVLLGFVVSAPGWLFALLTAVVLFRATSRARTTMRTPARVFLRMGAALVGFVGVLMFFGAVAGMFGGGDPDPGELVRPEAGNRVVEEAPEPGPPDQLGAIATPSGEEAVPSGRAVLTALFALGRAGSADEARPHAAAVARYFAAQGERLEDSEELRAALEGVGDLPLLSFNEAVFETVEEEFRRAGVLAAAGPTDAPLDVAGVDSLLAERERALLAADTGEVERLTREAALFVAADTIGTLRRRVSGLRGDVADLQDSVRAAQESAERSPSALFMDLIAEEIGVGAGWAALYFTAMLALWQGRTPGKRALGIRVIRLDGSALGWWASFERFGGYAAALATGTLGFFQILWDRNRQGVHDKISETVVIRDLPPRHAPATPLTARRTRSGPVRRSMPEER